MRQVPGREAAEFEWLLFEQHGVVSRRQALAAMSEGRLRGLVRSGRWAHPHRCVYVTHNGPTTSDQRVWIGVLGAACGRRAPIAGVTALEALGLKGVSSQTIHVLIPAHLRDTDPPPNVVVHRTSHLPAHDCLPGPPPRTSATRSVVDAAQWAGNDQRARTIIASAFQQRLVDGPAIEAMVARRPRLRRRALILSTVYDVAGGSDSVPELDFLQLCRGDGLPVPTRQSVVVDRGGRKRYRDAYFEEWKIHVEIDGGQHLEAAGWWDDMKRQNAMWIAGDRVLRFPAWALRNDPKSVLAQVRSALLEAGWTPPK